MLSSYQKGYTLIELLTILVIISALAAIGVTIYTAYLAKSTDARRKLDLRSLANALEVYYQKNNRFPCSGDDPFPNGPEYSYQSKPWIQDKGYAACNSTTAATLATSYISDTPKDPLSNDVFLNDNTLYGYLYWAGNPNKAGIVVCAGKNIGHYYVLITRLENSADPDRHEVRQYKDCSGNALLNPVDNRYKNLYIITSQ